MRLLRVTADQGDTWDAVVTGVIEERLDDAELEALWQELYESVRPRRADVKRADALFARLTKPARRKGVA